MLQLFRLVSSESTRLHLTWCSLIEVVSLPGLTYARVLCWLSVFSHHCASWQAGGLRPVPGRVVVPATICKMLGAFLTLTQACIEVVCIIAAGAVLDPLLKRGRPPDALIECSIRLKSMESSAHRVCPKVRKQ